MSISQHCKQRHRIKEELILKKLILKEQYKFKVFSLSAASGQNKNDCAIEVISLFTRNFLSFADFNLTDIVEWIVEDKMGQI